MVWYVSSCWSGHILPKNDNNTILVTPSFSHNRVDASIGRNLQCWAELGIPLFLGGIYIIWRGKGLQARQHFFFPDVVFLRRNSVWQPWWKISCRWVRYFTHVIIGITSSHFRRIRTLPCVSSQLNFAHHLFLRDTPIISAYSVASRVTLDNPKLNRQWVLIECCSAGTNSFHIEYRGSHPLHRRRGSTDQLQLPRFVGWILMSCWLMLVLQFYPLRACLKPVYWLSLIDDIDDWGQIDYIYKVY
jgi:hypothetical protein